MIASHRLTPPVNRRRARNAPPGVPPYRPHHRRSHASTYAAVLAAAMLFAVAAAPAYAQWKPTKPITIIVPWAAGGSTDQVTRVTAAEIEKALGQKVVIVNQPGARARSAPERDGGAEGRLHLDRRRARTSAPTRCWGCSTRRSATGHCSSTCEVRRCRVNPAAPYKTTTTVDAMKAKPGAISVATAGVNSSGHRAIEAIARARTSGTSSTYDGGNPAVVATVAGETEVTTQLTVEQAEMIRARSCGARRDRRQAVRARRLRRHRPITNSMPGIQGACELLRHLHSRRACRPRSSRQSRRSGPNEIARSAALKSYATSRGAQFAPSAGAEAQKAVMPAVQVNAWQAFDGGKAKVSPDTLGIPRP